MIYLLRHGEKIWNKQGRRQGWKDSPLTKKGCSQATANGVRLRKLLANGDAVKMYSSPQGRAWQTAVLVAEEINYPVNDILLENSLREISFGDWEGMTEPEVADRFPREWAKRNSDTWNNACPNGESYRDLRSRLEAWIRLTKLGETSIIVCHGQTSKVFRGIYAGLQPNEVAALSQPQSNFFELANGAIREVLE